METTQLGVLVNLPHTDGFSVLLYPRLKTAPPPRLTIDSGGKVVQVEHEACTRAQGEESQGQGLFDSSKRP
jgi:hypothetical protein